MKYKLFGKSGLRVSELCLSAIAFGQNPGDLIKGTDKIESRRLFDLFIESGGNFIDMSNTQQGGESERYIGEFCGQNRSGLVLASKFGSSTDSMNPNAGGTHRKNLFQSVEQSLKRLQTDYLDLLWVSYWDTLTPIEETVDALNDIVKSGKVLYIGFSNTPAWVVSRADALASTHGWSPIIGIDVMYGVFERAYEREFLPMARTLDLGILCWSEIARDVLSGKLTGQSSVSASISDWQRSIAKEVKRISDETGKTAAQICLNWLRHQNGCIVPLLGVRAEAQLKDQLGCLDFKLDEEHMRRLSKVSLSLEGYPMNIAEGPETIGRQFGVENHRC